MSKISSAGLREEGRANTQAYDAGADAFHGDSSDHVLQRQLTGVRIHGE